MRKRPFAMLGLAGLIVVADQITKLLVAQARPHLRVIPGFFNLIYVENPGAAFGILQGKQALLSGVNALAAVVIIYLIFHEREDRKGMLYALACILGGDIGNLIDRVRLGYVVDFLDFHFHQYRWPAFNIADSAITVGVALLILVTLREEWHRNDSAEKIEGQVEEETPQSGDSPM